MSRLRRTYELRRYSRSDDRNFQAAIKLYNRTITGPYRTNSNEISYWVDNYERFAPDQFCVTGFYSNELLVGYAQFAYFDNERIVAVDYILLHEHHRSHGEYFQFSGMLQRWIDEQGWAVDYYVAEVQKEASSSIKAKATLVDLFHLMGFAVADCDYVQPRLGEDNIETDAPSHFLIRATEPRTAISVESFSRILNTLFFKHYGRWYDEFVGDRVGYRKTLQLHLDTLRAEAERKGQVALNGVQDVQELLPPAPPAELSTTPLKQSLLVSASMLIICGVLLFYQDIFHRDARTVMTFVGASLLISSVSFALFYRRGAWLLRQVMGFLKPNETSRKRKSRSNNKP